MEIGDEAGEGMFQSFHAGVMSSSARVIAEFVAEGKAGEVAHWAAPNYLPERLESRSLSCVESRHPFIQDKSA